MPIITDYQRVCYVITTFYIPLVLKNNIVIALLGSLLEKLKC